MSDRSELVGWAPVGEVRVTTENSVWLLRDGWYQRFPKAEGPRPFGQETGGRVSDGTWIPQHGLFWFTDRDGDRMKIWPSIGHTINGVNTGIIETVTGDWDVAVPVGPGRSSTVFWQPLETGAGPNRWLRFTDLEPDKETRAKHRVDLFENTVVVKTWEIFNTRADGHEALVEAAVGSIRWGAGR